MTETAISLGRVNKHNQFLLSENASETVSAFLGAEDAMIATWYLSLCEMGEKDFDGRSSRLWELYEMSFIRGCNGECAQLHSYTLKH